MICFLRDFLPEKRLPVRLNVNPDLVIFTGCRRERIHAEFDRFDRVRRLIIHTKQKSLRI